jgi:predicted glycosyltransferase
MRIWIDLANSPHVPFFRPLIADFRALGHEVFVTARAFAQTVELAERAGLSPVVIGTHGGAGIGGKAREIFGRAFALASWARGKDFDLAVSHNSYAQIVAARLLRIPSATLMDYEHQPANYLAFRLARRVIVPASFPAASLKKYGADVSRVRRYEGIKEDVYLADFAPDAMFAAELRHLGVAPEDVVIVVRPPAREALYHRFDNTLFDELVEFLLRRENVRIIMLARTEAQREQYREQWKSHARLVMPERALDGSNLIAAADLVVSAGGTMNREAAALGTPAATVYAGEWGAVDEMLVGEGRLRRIASRDDFEKLKLEKKDARGFENARRGREAYVRGEVARLILETAKVTRSRVGV